MGTPGTPNAGLVIRRAQLAEHPGALWDVHVADGMVVDIRDTTAGARGAERDPAASAMVPSAPVDGQPAALDVAGALVLPSFTESHCHADKTLWGKPHFPHIPATSVAERVRIDHEHRETLGMPSVASTTALLEQMVSRGTTHVRSHVEVDPRVGLRGVHVVAEAAAALAGMVTVQQVAFPQSGVVRHPEMKGMLEDAVAAGATVVGGIDPARDEDPHAHLGIIFDVAAASGSGVDLHLHDRTSLGLWELELICRYAVEHDLGGRVNVSHALALADTDVAVLGTLAERMAAAGVSITTCVVNDDPVLPVQFLRRAGVLVTAGSDSIRNTWSPLGNGDMLDRVWLLATRCGLRTDEAIIEAIDIASLAGRTLVGADDARPANGALVGPGMVADLVILDATSASDAVARRPDRRTVIRNGQVVWSPDDTTRAVTPPLDAPKG